MQIRKFLFFFLFAFGIIAGNVAAAESTAQSVEKKTEQSATAVAKRYQHVVVEIETRIKYASGLEAGFGGAGMFLDSNGYILTVAHVVYDDEDLKKDLNLDSESNSSGDIFDILMGGSKKDKTYQYWVVYKGRKYPAKLIGSNRYIDIALLKIDPKKVKDKFESALLGNSAKVEVGEKVIAIGSPVGLTNTVTDGIVSAIGRRFGEEGLSYVEDYIQTSSAINPGNSGGPLINLKGEVIGLNDAGIFGADGLGFAVPINLAKDSVPRMYKEGKIKCGWMGAKTLNKNFNRTGGFSDMAEIHELTGIEDRDTLAKLADMTVTHSALVTYVSEKSPAAAAGLMRGDIVVEFNGKEIKEGVDLRYELTKTKIGEKVSMKIIRVEEGKEKTLKLKLALGDRAKMLLK